jgi:hypothetical protein
LLNHPRSSATVTTPNFYSKPASTVKLFFIFSNRIIADAVSPDISARKKHLPT